MSKVQFDVPSGVRLELFFKTLTEVAPLMAFVKQHQNPITSSPYRLFNIPNKHRNENLVPYATKVLEAIPDADICLHYSIKNNKFRTMEDTLTHLKDTAQIAASCGVKELMVVSGSGDKRDINSASCLLAWSLQCQIPNVSAGLEPFQPPLRIAVAYSPYFFTEPEIYSEQQHLLHKLESGLVSHIYVQFGSDLILLRQGILFLQNKVRNSYPNIHMSGSVFLPSKVLLARFKYRPWKGVHLSPDFLSSVEEAEVIVKHIIDLYREACIDVIVETPVKVARDMKYMEEVVIHP